MTILDGFHFAAGIALFFAVIGIVCIVAQIILIVAFEIFDLLFSKTWRAYRAKQMRKLFYKTIERRQKENPDVEAVHIFSRINPDA